MIGFVCDGPAEVSRVKAQQECLVLDQLHQDTQEGESKDEGINREASSEPRDVKSGCGGPRFL